MNEYDSMLIKEPDEHPSGWRYLLVRVLAIAATVGFVLFFLAGVVLQVKYGRHHHFTPEETKSFIYIFFMSSFAFILIMLFCIKILQVFVVSNPKRPLSPMSGGILWRFAGGGRRWWVKGDSFNNFLTVFFLMIAMVMFFTVCKHIVWPIIECLYQPKL